MKAPKNRNTHFYCFNEKGECDLPTLNQIDEAYSDGVEPVLFLDSNVCLNIIKLVDKGRYATNYNKDKVVNLKEYISKTGMNINAMFSVMELCQNNGVFDPDKAADFKYRIDFFKQIPLKYFKRFDYDYMRDFYIYKNVNFGHNDNWFGIEPKILFSYCTLLKIRSLALKGVAKRHAKQTYQNQIGRYQ